MKVVYSQKMVSDNHVVSPSAVKPRLFAEYLQNNFQNIEFVEPIPVTIEDICRCHDSTYVNDIMSLKKANGFGTKSQAVVDSLPYTNGAMVTAAKLALETKEPVCALVSGFHHAGYDRFDVFGYFCTFNGLMITATKLVAEGLCKKVAIVDCDMHVGNGTDDILKTIDPHREKYINISFGRTFGTFSNPRAYLNYFEIAKKQLINFEPDIIIYQSGADVHKDDPFGGLLSEEEMYERDVRMFQIAKELNLPIAWDLAGGYQKDADGGCSYVLKLHGNTVKALQEVYG